MFPTPSFAAVLQVPPSPPSGSPWWLAYLWYGLVVVALGILAGLWLLQQRKTQTQGLDKTTIGQLQDALKARDIVIGDHEKKIADHEKRIAEMAEDLNSAQTELTALAGIAVTDILAWATKGLQAEMAVLRRDHEALRKECEIQAIIIKQNEREKLGEPQRGPQ